jgi:hypothetical protein
MMEEMFITAGPDYYTFITAHHDQQIKDHVKKLKDLASCKSGSETSYDAQVLDTDENISDSSGIPYTLSNLLEDLKKQCKLTEQAISHGK